MIESMMQAERRDFLNLNPGNKGNDLRQEKNYGQALRTLVPDPMRQTE